MSAVNPTEIRARFQDLTVWTRGEQRAPHKPLLLLYALGRYARGEPRLIPWAELESDLQDLLFEFGPPRQSYHPEYPFGRLRRDAVWEVQGAAIREGRDLRVTELRENEAMGGMLPEIHEEVTRDPALLQELAHMLLEAHFPGTLHKLFDRGAFSLSDGRRVTVSEQAHGGAGLDDWLLRFHGSGVRDPVNPKYRPEESYLEWHREEVFRGPGRV